MNLHNSYFSVGNPLHVLDRWLNPYSNNVKVDYLGKEMVVQWTQRAEREMQKRSIPLIVEMQLYFTCVVKKRVLFHDNVGLETVLVKDALSITFRSVESESCDPDEFAKNFPAKRQLNSSNAKRFRPSCLALDFQNDHWVGEFTI